ncbi:hypothetical protein MMC09_002839 [Bachmanniomyces sp. S44760]|nr:hypothetical protein [Bachmanniomyces sp. S44760]
MALHQPKPNTQLPRMPFSSPMGEEVLTPASILEYKPTNTSPRRYAQARYDTRKESLPVRRRSTATQNDTRKPSQAGQSKERYRAKPGLNVITNLSRPSAPIRAQTDPVNAGVEGLERIPSRLEAKAFVPTSKSDNSYKSSGPFARNNNGVGRGLSRKPKFQEGLKGTVGSLKRADSKLIGLSPSDRTLVIGLSIPSSKFTPQWASPDTKNSDRSGQTLEVPASSKTPEIVVTPVDGDSPWTEHDPRQERPYGRRPSSSMYSRRARDTSQCNDTPNESAVPLPPLPSTKYAPREQHHAEPKPTDRITSWGTDFEEDDSPRIDQKNRPQSGESQKPILQRLSIDTSATKHRSQGWWNQILSPFLSRQNTLASRHSPRDDDAPAMPELPRSLDGPAEITVRQHEPTVGEAAEYFDACWHDQNSPSPYFKCENHSCLPMTHAADGNVGASEAAATGEDIARDLTVDGPIGDQPQHNISGFRQAPMNRFSAAFAQAAAPRERPQSSETIIDEDPDETPEIQAAHAAPVVRARSPIPTLKTAESESIAERQVPMSTSPKPTVASTNPPPSYATYTPQQKGRADVSRPVTRELTPDLKETAAQPTRRDILQSREGSQIDAEKNLRTRPVGPASNREKMLPEDLPKLEATRDAPAPPVQNTYYINQYYGPRDRDQITLADLEPAPKPYDRPKEKPGTYYEPPPKSEKKVKKKKESFKFKSCLRAKTKDKKKKRCRCIAIFCALLAMVILIIVLAMTLTHRHVDTMPVESQWLNITGYPPVPTGITTVAQPNAEIEDSDCVQPATMWSCAVPKEDQASIAPSSPDQPNFRIEIRFRNGTIAPNGTSVTKRSWHGNTAGGSGIFARGLKFVRDGLSDALYTPNPPPPSQEDQVFLGNTTDNVTTPFDGEYTPFYISFLDTTPLGSAKMVKRQDQSQNVTNSTDPFPNLPSAIPPPALNSDGTAAPANLLTMPSAQPLRLYNRGQASEHYGFYTYFDRSIFLKSTDLVNSTGPAVGEVPSDTNGGSEEVAATVRCTWTQTRFLVQIWTNQGNGVSLLPEGNSTSTPTSTTSSSAAATPTSSSNLTLSSANNFTRPGSFPYPISITLDRHGGDITKKMIYCYGLDDREHVITGAKKIQLENRAVGGVLVNPALGAFGNVNVSLSDGGPGGIDGGSGGCKCLWQNWQAK